MESQVLLEVKKRRYLQYRLEAFHEYLGSLILSYQLFDTQIPDVIDLAYLSLNANSTANPASMRANAF